VSCAAGGCLGGMDFRERALRVIDGLTDRLEGRKQIDSGARRDHTEAEAERLVTRALEALGLKNENLAHMKKNDERKILIGALARKQTLASNAWIGARLHMGDPTRVSRYCGSGGKRTDPAFQRKLGNLKKMAISMD
jgi:hypothetical protein